MAELLTKQQVHEKVRKLLEHNTHHGYSDVFKTEYWTIHPSRCVANQSKCFLTFGTISRR